MIAKTLLHIGSDVILHVSQSPTYVHIQTEEMKPSVQLLMLTTVIQGRDMHVHLLLNARLLLLL